MQCWQSGQACTTPTRVTAPAKSIISKLKLVDLHMMTKLTWSSLSHLKRLERMTRLTWSSQETVGAPHDDKTDLVITMDWWNSSKMMTRLTWSSQWTDGTQVR